MPVIDFPHLSSGMNEMAPQRLLGSGPQGPFLRYIQDFETDNGVLEGPRPYSSASSPTPDVDDGAVFVVEEFRGGEATLCVTSEEIFWYYDGSWVNLTPTYTTGKVDVTNGSAVVIENGAAGNTLWSDRKISAGCLFIGPDTNVYTIDTVDSNTQITLTTNYSGGTLTNQDYTIRRRFHHKVCSHLNFVSGETVFNKPLFADVFNGDLFVAGMLAGADDFGTLNDWADIPAVIRVTDVFNTSVSSDDAEYIVSSEELTDGMDVLPELEEIRGLQFHDDGRVMIACWAKDTHYHTGTIDSDSSSTTVTGHGTRWEDADIQNGDTITIGGTDETVSSVTSNTELELTANATNTVTDDTYMIARGGGRGSSVRNRYYFSSNIDQGEWIRSPAGFGDIPMVPSKLNAMGRLGRSTTFHFDGGIALGSPSGQDDPPLNIQVATHVAAGCVQPRTLAVTPMGEMYLGPEWSIYVFDGAQVRMLSDPVRSDLRSELNSVISGQPYAYYDEQFQQYRFFSNASNYLRPGKEYRYHLVSGQWTLHSCGAEVASGDKYAHTAHSSFGRLAGRHRSANAGGTQDYLVTEDDTSGLPVATNEVPYFDTDWLDAGMPNIDKSWHTIYLWVEDSYSGTSTLKAFFKASGDGSFKPASIGEQVTLAGDGGNSIEVLQFSFDPVIAEAVQVRIQGDSTNTFKHKLVRMQVEYEVAGPVPHAGGSDNS